MKIFKIFRAESNITNYYNSQEFYKKHPDLAPRNIYLAMGRVLDREDIQRYFDKHFGDTFLQKCGKTIKKLWNKIYR